MSRGVLNEKIASIKINTKIGGDPKLQGSPYLRLLKNIEITSTINVLRKEY